jgi:DNA helicase-2/ATP-dependent DNA helicase PcrA
MDYASLLNEKQLAAVTTTSQYVRIVAGAGSGKTRVLTYRISYLVSERHEDPSKILAIAFTNKVANEMKERASKLVDEILGYSPALHISTFHSFCARFLRSECKAIGYPSTFTIYDEDDQKSLVKSFAPSLGYRKGDDMVKNAFNYIKKMKMKGLYPDDIDPKKSMFEEDKIYHKFYALYEEKKTASLALDFDDLLLKTIEILTDYPLIRNSWAHRFHHILVDEFQDTNDIQYKLMTLLLTPDTCVYVVGDPDQTIYTWRGANQNIIMGFDKTFPNAETIILNENYRSTKTILGAANKLIMHNKKRVPKDLYTNGVTGEKITANESSTPEQEADWVANRVASIANKQLNDEHQPVFSNIAILYRSSYMTRPFEAALKDRGIAYRIFGGLRFYERAEVKDLLAYFNLLINPQDNVSFERIINVPRRGVGETSLEKIRDESTAAGLSEYEYLRHIDKYADDTNLSTRVITALSVLIVEMEETKKRLSENLEAYSGILKDFVTKIGYYTYLSSEEDIDEDRVKNVNALFDDITHFISSNPEASFAQYLQNVTLLSAQDDMNAGNYVSLMTIHVAKGLEFDYVFVISMNDGAFPSARAQAESGRDALEEERRLAYVAFTRAKKQLFVSCNSGYSYVTDSHSTPSCFITEAGITMPKNEYSMSTWNDYSPHYKKTVSNFFSDGPSISPFEENEEDNKVEEKKVVEKPATNGITDWRIGDRINHERFGEGVVIEVQDSNVIVVKFASCGVKTLLGSHPMISRLASKGGQA